MSGLLNKILIIILLSLIPLKVFSEEKNNNFIETNWTFSGLFGTFRVARSLGKY